MTRREPHERPITYQQENSHKAILDAEWYNEFVTIGSFQAYEYLDDTDSSRRKAAKEDFLSDETSTRNPELAYPKLDDNWIRETEERLLDLKKRIIAGESNPVVKQAYRWRINEKIAEVRLMRAMRNGDAYAIQAYSNFIYGTPRTEIFSHAWQMNVAPILLKAEQSSEPIQQRVAKEIHERLGAKTHKTESISLPTADVIQTVREQTEAALGDAILIEVPAYDGQFNDQAIQTAFQQAIHSLGIEGWEVTIEKDKTSISANQEKRQVQIPENRSTDIKKLIGLIAHEIGTHALRRHNGERTKLQLLGIGLDRYEGGEEGVATMREQVVNGKVSDFSGSDLYLAAGLAKSLDQGSASGRDFRSTFEIIYRIELLKKLQGGEEMASATSKAKDTAWTRCVRIFRGTDCKTPGIIFTKDIIYREGNIGVWQLVSKNTNAMMQFSLGKFDPANSRHGEIIEYVSLASQTEINEEDLAKMREIEARFEQV